MRYTTARFGEVAHLPGKFPSGRRPAQSFTTFDLGADTATLTAHGYVDGDGPHRIMTTGALPTGLVADTDYWIIAVDANTIAFALNRANALADIRIPLSGSFSGTHTLSNPITIKLVNMSTGALLTLTTADCTELTSTASGGFSTYRWPSSNIFTQPTVQSEFLYVMTDAYTLRVQEGKFVLGGFPDESARRRYGNQVHISPTGSALPTAATMAAATLSFITGSPNKLQRVTGNWVTDGFAVGQRIQVTNSALNDGVKGPILAISTTSIPNDTLEFSPGTFVSEPGVVGVGVVAKSFLFPLGTEEVPVGDIRDAVQILQELEFNEIHILGTTVPVDFNVDGIRFVGNDQDEDSIEFQAGSSHEGCRLRQLRIYGPILNGRLICNDCILDGDAGTIEGVEGVFIDTAIKDAMQVAAGGEFVGNRIASRSALATVIDMGAGGTFLAGSVQGVFTITNMVGGLVGLSIAGTIVSMLSSCTGGTATFIGYGEFTDGSNGTAVVDFVLRGSRLNTLLTSRASAADVAVLLNANASRARINIGNGTTDTWREEHYTYVSGGPPDTVISLTYELYDQAGAAINGSHLSGNNPLADTSRILAERRRI